MSSGAGKGKRAVRREQVLLLEQLYNIAGYVEAERAMTALLAVNTDKNWVCLGGIAGLGFPEGPTHNITHDDRVDTLRYMRCPAARDGHSLQPGPSFCLGVNSNDSSSCSTCHRKLIDCLDCDGEEGGV